MLGKKILITGGDGFLGKILVEEIKKIGCEVFIPRIEEYDLRKEDDVKKIFEEQKPEIVVHLAANVGSTGYIKENSASVFFDNVIMNTLVLEYSRKYNVEKFVGIGSAFEYSKNSEIFKEEQVLEGDVEDDSSAYSISKRIMLMQSQIYRKRYNFNKCLWIRSRAKFSNNLYDQKIY